jgi:cell division protein ZapA (FtsZ GTPase activity inhibitor)
MQPGYSQEGKFVNDKSLGYPTTMQYSGGGWVPYTAPSNPQPKGDVLGASDVAPDTSAQDQLTSELDNIFSPVFSALQGQENTLNQNYATVPGEINAQYGTSSEALNQQKTSGMAELGNQETSAGNRKNDALTAATRLFNELQRGGQQRFGGASSAGEAYGALTAVEQQRRQGTIQGSYETAMQQIGTYKQNLIDKAALAQQDLENQKNAALNQAARDFRDALQQIQSAKTQAQSDKATATMNTLQDYRNKVYTINQQSLSFAQSLAANNQLSLKAVDDYTTKVAQSLSGGNVALTNFGNQATTTANQTNYGNTTTPTSTASTYTGQMQSMPGKTWDPATGTWV